MKRIAIIIAFFILMSLTSCNLTGSKQDAGEAGQLPASGNEAQTAKAPPTVNVYIDGSIDPENATIDPIYEDGKINSILALCFEGLFKFGEDENGKAQTELCLAESYTVDGDKAYSFTLKPDVKFYDETAVTVEDWIWSFERLSATPESPWVTYAGLIESVTAPSADKLVITLKQPHANFESILALPCFSVQSKKHFEELGEETYVTDPMGTGMYYISYWNIRDRYLLYRNHHFSGQNNSNADVTFWVINDPEIRLEQLQKHGGVCVSPPQDKPLDSQRFGLEAFSSAEQRYICFNTTLAPFDNPQVRRALRMATDKDAIIAKELMGQGEKAYNVFMDSSLYFNDGIADEGFDIDRAEAILAEAGYPEGFSCEMSYNSESETAMMLAQALSDQWGKIGVEMQLSALEPADLNARLSDLSYGVATMRWADETNDPSALASFITLYNISQGFYTGYKNSDLAELLAKAADDAERENSYRQIQQLLYEECPMFPIYKEATILAIENGIEGFKITKLGYFDLNNLQYK